jgi:hypothetical protein
MLQTPRGFPTWNTGMSNAAWCYLEYFPAMAMDGAVMRLQEWKIQYDKRSIKFTRRDPLINRAY